MIGDRHLHTSFSFDSDTAPKETIEAAMRLGMTEICITDHCDLDLGTDWIMPADDYFPALLALKEEYAGRIDVHIGVEMGLNAAFGDEIDRFLSRYPFEYVIGSIHTMLGKDPFFREHYEMKDADFFRIYFETAYERLRTGTDIDVFGHFDYVVRYGTHKGNFYHPEENAEVIDAILSELIRRDIAIELNTGGLRKGIDFVHPHPYILKRYKELGGHWISVGSDAHTAKDVGSGFEQALAVMEAFGLCERDLKGYRG